MCQSLSLSYPKILHYMTPTYLNYFYSLSVHFKKLMILNFKVRMNEGHVPCEVSKLQRYLFVQHALIPVNKAKKNPHSSTLTHCFVINESLKKIKTETVKKFTSVIIFIHCINLLLHKRVPIFGRHSWSVPVFLSIHLQLLNSPLQRIPAGNKNNKDFGMIPQLFCFHFTAPS